jgi:transcription factor C subunit 6
MPYVVASTPIGGISKIVDLRAPSYETSAVQAGIICTQPNLLAFSDHLLGFFSLFPSSNTLNTTIGFMHASHYPVARRIFTGDSLPTCLAVGKTHPCLLVGTSDGSLWALNPMLEIFSTRRERSDRLRIFQHEHRRASNFPPGSLAAERGASRIVYGFAMDKNGNPRVEVKKAPKKKAKKSEQADEDGAQNDNDDETGGTLDPSRGVVHEPRTRITVVEWNPNKRFGSWAAVAMGSGLVRVMDLGL